MTRYEMAQIVAKAMAKGANVDRLAVEFADELDSLGVRVAALEKKADNVKITGQIRYEYAGRDGDFKKDKGSVAKNRLRTRLFVNGSVNEDWTYTARIQNDRILLMIPVMKIPNSIKPMLQVNWVDLMLWQGKRQYF